MTISEIIKLYNTWSEVVEGPNMIGSKTLPINQIEANRQIALANLEDKTKDELIAFIKGSFFNTGYYPTLC